MEKCFSNIISYLVEKGIEWVGNGMMGVNSAVERLVMWKSPCVRVVGPTYIYIARESMLFCGIQSGCSVFESSYSLH